jgi:hypothetical protein
VVRNPQKNLCKKFFRFSELHKNHNKKPQKKMLSVTGENSDGEDRENSDDEHDEIFDLSPEECKQFETDIKDMSNEAKWAKFKSVNIDTLPAVLMQEFWDLEEWHKETACCKYLGYRLFKPRLDRVFEALKKSHHILAKQNFTCCPSCGHRGCQEILEEMPVRLVVAPYLFYHVQTLDSFREDMQEFKPVDMYLQFGLDTDIDLSEEEEKVFYQDFARNVRVECRRENIRFEWNGDPATSFRFLFDLDVTRDWDLLWQEVMDHGFDTRQMRALRRLKGFHRFASFVHSYEEKTKKILSEFLNPVVCIILDFLAVAQMTSTQSTSKRKLSQRE